MEKGLLPNYYMGQVALDYANQPLHALGDFFHIYLPYLGACLALCFTSVLNVKAP